MNTHLSYGQLWILTVREPFQEHWHFWLYSISCFCCNTDKGCTGCYSGPPTCDNPQPDEFGEVFFCQALYYISTVDDMNLSNYFDPFYTVQNKWLLERAKMRFLSLNPCICRRCKSGWNLKKRAKLCLRATKNTSDLTLLLVLVKVSKSGSFGGPTQVWLNR